MLNYKQRIGSGFENLERRNLLSAVSIAEIPTEDLTPRYDLVTGYHDSSSAGENLDGQPSGDLTPRYDLVMGYHD